VAGRVGTAETMIAVSPALYKAAGPGAGGVGEHRWRI